MHNQKEDNNQSKINKQKVPEYQTAWNSDNQGIKVKINQNNQTCKAADHVGQLRKTAACGNAEDHGGRADCPDQWAAWEGLKYGDSKVAVGYRGYSCGRRSQSHMRVC